MMKMRASKQAHNVIKQGSRPSLPRNLKVANNSVLCSTPAKKRSDFFEYRRVTTEEIYLIMIR